MVSVEQAVTPEDFPVVYSKAVFEKDLDAYLNLYDRNVFIFDAWGPAWHSLGIESWREQTKEWFESLGTERVEVKFDFPVWIHGQDVSTLTAIAEFAAVDEKGTRLRSLENRFTCVFKKISGHWKVIHQHTSNPIDGGTMKSILKR
jgi:ketosteroid isomerase-like protein